MSYPIYPGVSQASHISGIEGQLGQEQLTKPLIHSLAVTKVISKDETNQTTADQNQDQPKKSKTAYQVLPKKTNSKHQSERIIKFANQSQIYELI